MLKNLCKSVLRKCFWGFLRYFLSDRQYIKLRYWLELDRLPNLEHPTRFTEKIQFLKLHQCSDLRRLIANRVTVRDYVEEKVGASYLIPLMGTFEGITPNDWQRLPAQFVLKANHGCGMVRIVRDKTKENYAEVYQQTEKWKRTNYANFGRERVYEGLPRTIVAEKLLLNVTQSIPEDYKFFCFDGRVEIMQIDFDRFGKQKRNLYDRNFNQLEATLLYPRYDGEVEKPPNLEQAIEVAETLSSELNFVRVDLYLLDDTIYFGELTNFPGNGFVPFKPESMEYKAGALLKL